MRPIEGGRETDIAAKTGTDCGTDTGVSAALDGGRRGIDSGEDGYPNVDEQRKGTRAS